MHVEHADRVLDRSALAGDAHRMTDGLDAGSVDHQGLIQGLHEAHVDHRCMQLCGRLQSRPDHASEGKYPHALAAPLHLPTTDRELAHLRIDRRPWSGPTWIAHGDGSTEAK